MPLPAAYTEGSLLGFMETVVGPHLEGLGLDASDALTEAVNDVIGILGNPLADETSTADLMKVRTIARWQAWAAAVDTATDQFDLKAGSADLKRSQMFEQMERRLAAAEAAAMRYEEAAAVLAGGSTAYVSSIGVIGDPYAYPSLTEWG